MSVLVSHYITPISGISPIRVVCFTSNTCLMCEKSVMGDKKSQSQYFNKNGAFALEMTRGLQIRAQNLNRTTFDPILAKKNAQNWQNPVFDRFLTKEGSHSVLFKF